MPSDFQKLMDITLVSLDCTFAYINNILIVTEGEKSVPMQKVREVLDALDRLSLQLRADKRKDMDKIRMVGIRIVKVMALPQ